jgi:hypothetical protein
MRGRNVAESRKRLSRISHYPKHIFYFRNPCKLTKRICAFPLAAVSAPIVQQDISYQIQQSVYCPVWQFKQMITMRPHRFS